MGSGPTPNASPTPSADRPGSSRPSPADSSALTTPVPPLAWVTPVDHSPTSRTARMSFSEASPGDTPSAQPTAPQPLTPETPILKPTNGSEPTLASNFLSS